MKMKEHFVIVWWLLVALLIGGAESTGTLDQLSVRAETPEPVSRTRSEIDLATEKSVVICAGQNKSLECFSPGSTIAIQEAFWGRLSSEICPSEDGDPVTNCLSDHTTTPIVRKLCDDKEYCEIPARHNVLQPPGVKHCPGVNKYLAVKYTCMPEKHKFVLCNGETTELTCGQGWKIHIMSTYWGRDSPSTCPTALGKFFTCANSADSVLALKSRCSGKESCIVTADDQHLSKSGDHCPGIDKYAVISYRCQPHVDEKDAQDDSNKKPLDSLQEDTVHSSLDLTSSAKSPAPQSTMGELNLSMLLPIPQSQASDKLKPIIEFLGVESQGKILKNSSSLGDNLPIPKDSRPGVTRKMDSSTASQSQHVIAPSILAKQKGISSSLGQSLSAGVSTVNGKGIFANPTQKSLQNGNLKTVNHDVVTDVAPSPDNTEELVKSFLETKFGQALGKNLLSLGSGSDVSYKNLMAQHFGSSVKATAAPAKQPPPNVDLIAKLFSGLGLQSTEQDTTANSVANSKNVNNKKITQDVKEVSGVTNSVSSPTISIGSQVFSLDALSNALNHGNGSEENTQNVSNVTNGNIEAIKSNRKHSVTQKNKAKIKQLSEKIATLETLSDALDALTAKLSSDEKPDDQPVSQNLDVADIPGRRHKSHHTHHHHHREKAQLEEDVEVLGALLSRANTNSGSVKKPNDNPQNQKDPNYIVGLNGENSLNSGDLQVLQSKINKAIEMAEGAGRQHDTKQAKSTWLPLLLAGKGIQEEGAHTREEVTTIHANHSIPEGSIILRDNKMLGLQEILTGLIDNALRTGSLNQLVQNWNRSGSPFAKIAQNVSLFLQGNGSLKLPVSRRVNNAAVTTSLARKPMSTVNSTLTSRLLKGISGFDETSLVDKRLFTKAVDNILGVIAKRQGFQKRNTSANSLYEITDTLTDFKGVLLGGRINKLIPREDSIARLGTKIVTEILRDQANDSVKTNSPKRHNQTIGNKIKHRNNMTIDVKPFDDDDHGKSLEKEKLKFSNYETRNMSISIQNNTLMEFMNSLSKTGSQNTPSPLNDNQGDKHSHVRPHLSDLMSVITASLLDMEEADQDSSLHNTTSHNTTSHNNKAQFQYDESGGERFLNRLPNDHISSDYSTVDMVLKAPNDHTDKGNSKAKRPGHLLSSSPSAHTLTQNKTRGLNNKTSTYKKNENADLSDQTVTLTLETVDDTPSPLAHNNGEPKDQTGLRSNKVPHYINIQAATTLGKINSTASKNIEHSFHESDVSTLLSEFIADKKKPELPSPSGDDGKLITISPSPGVGGDSKTKTIANLPLGLQMSAIGRLADDTDDEASVTPSDMSAALTSNSGLVERMALKSTHRKSPEDTILPMASDLTSTGGATSGGETEAIASKAASTTTPVETPIKATPERELPTASEVREISTSIKSLLKILNSYSKRLRLEDDEHDSRSDLLPARSRTAEKVANVNEGKTKEVDPKIKQAGSNNNFEDVFHANLQQEESLNSLIKPSRTSLIDKKVDSNNPYVNFPQSSPLTPNYVDSGSFEHIQEQPITDPTVNNFNWNFDPLQAHAQNPLDTNPTKSSVQPQLVTDPWSPGKEVSRVTEELKDLNLPSIEDDPTVRAVQKMVAEENVYESQKRKAIQRLEQQVSSVKNSHLPEKLGIFDRNTIPKGKGKGHQRNQIRAKQGNKEISSGKRNIRKKPSTRGRERNEIPHVIEKKRKHSGHQTLGLHRSRPTLKGRFIQNSTNQKESHRQMMTGSGGKLTQPVSRRNRLPGSGNHSPLNNSVSVATHRNNVIKTKTSLNKEIQKVQPNAVVNRQRGESHGDWETNRQRSSTEREKNEEKMRNQLRIQALMRRA